MTLGISDEDFENAIDAAAPRRIDLAHENDFTIGPIRVVPSLRLLRNGAAETVIEPKVMQVLVALGSQVEGGTGTILSRDDLIERCWEGRIVGESSINRVISLLRSGLKSVGEEAVCVENVPKVGYRLMVSSHWQAEHDAACEAQEEAASALSTPTASERPRWLVLAGGAVALVAIVLAAQALWPSAPATPVERIKVAMLPLKASEGVDPLYARGLEEELRTQLARVGRMEVTSSESARQLFAKGLSADEICRKLGADFAWIGALDVEEDRVILSARLIEASTKQDAFRERLTSSPGTAQTLPLRTARAITTALGRPVSERLAASSVSASDFQLYLTALGLIKSRGDEQRVAALDILEQITARNPDFADGWAGLAKAWFLLPVDDKDAMQANRARADEVARKALDIDPETVDALKILGMLETTAPRQRLDYLKRATQLDPGDPEAWFWRSMTQGKFALQAEDPVSSAAKVVAIDPLWPASWLSSDLAATFGKVEDARAFEQSIALAAVTPSQRLLAEARLAQIDGDLSRFVTLTREAQPTLTATERRFGAKVPLRMVQQLLDVPLTSGMGGEMAGEPMGAGGALRERLEEGALPLGSEFAAAGLAGADLWSERDLAELAAPLFIRDGRESELIAAYDAAFARHEDFLAYAQKGEGAHEIIPALSPYLALALQRVGRENEAQAHIASLEAQVERWRAAETGSFVAVINELKLAALQGDETRAIALVERLPDYGWPYTMGHKNPASIALLGDDPLYDDLRAVAEVEAVLAPVRATLEREREEVLALGV